MPGMFPAYAAFQRRTTAWAPPKARGVARCWKAVRGFFSAFLLSMPYGTVLPLDRGESVRYGILEAAGRRLGAWCGVLLGWVVCGGRLRCENATFLGPKASRIRTSTGAVRERDGLGPESVANPHLNRSSEHPPSREGAREGAGEGMGGMAPSALAAGCEEFLELGAGHLDHDHDDEDDALDGVLDERVHLEGDDDLVDDVVG